MTKRIKDGNTKQPYGIVTAIVTFTTVFYAYKLYPYNQLADTMQLATVVGIFICALGIIKLRYQKNSIESSWNIRALAGTGRDLLALMVLLTLLLTMYSSIKAQHLIVLLLGVGVSNFMIRLLIIKRQEG